MFPSLMYFHNTIFTITFIMQSLKSHSPNVLKITLRNKGNRESKQTFVLMKTSSRRLDQDEYIRLSQTSSEDIFKTSWSWSIYSSWPYASLQDVFKTPSRRLQGVFKTSSRHLDDVFKTSSKRLQDILKMSSRGLAKVLSGRIIRVNCLPRSRICLGHTTEKFMVSVENLEVWYKFLKF